MAAVTVVAVIVVLAGPPVMECAGSPAGMGSCLRDKLAGMGFGTGTTPATDPVPVEEPAPPEQPVEVAAPRAPEITLLRAEPDGSVVMAGTGEPGSDITVYGGTGVIGETSAESSGDWTLVPEAPLPAGETVVTVGAAGTPPQGAPSLVVTIDPGKQAPARIVLRQPDGSEEVLTPGAAPTEATPAFEADEAAEALQEEAAPTAFTNEIVAEVPVPETVPIVEAASGAAPAREPAPAKAADEVAALPRIARDFSDTIVAEIPAPVSVPAVPDAASPAEVAVGEPAPPLPGQTAAVPFGGGIVAEVPDVALDAEPAEVAAGSGQTGKPEAETEQDLASAQSFDIIPEVPGIVATPPEAEVAAAEDAEAAEAAENAPPDDAAVAVTPPTIEAIEIDGDATLIAGTGEDGTTVRVYVDGTLAGESPVDGGHWLVESTDIEMKPSQRVRAEVAVAGTTAGTEVNFVVDLPEPDLTQPVELAPVAPAVTWTTEIVAEIPAIDTSPVFPSGLPLELPPDVPSDALAGSPMVIANTPESDDEPVAPSPALEDMAAPVAEEREEVAPSGKPSDDDGVGAGSAGSAPVREMAADPPESTGDGPDLPVREVAALPAPHADGIVAEIPPAPEVAALPEEQPAVPSADPPESTPPPTITEAAPLGELLPADGDEAVSPDVVVADLPQEATEMAPADPVAGIVLPSFAVPAREARTVADVAAPAAVPSTEADESAEPAESRVPTIRAIPLSALGPIRYPSGQAIIRRGDTLWTISRRVYGSGAKYQTIYRANRDRIPRPGRIYPGQVLDIPLVYED